MAFCVWEKILKSFSGDVGTRVLSLITQKLKKNYMYGFAFKKHNSRAKKNNGQKKF